MVLKHMYLVERIASVIHFKLPRNILLEDIVHSGVVGLLDAIDKYDPLRGVPFACYAGYRIRGAILDSLRVLDWGSRGLRRKARDLEQTRQSLSYRLCRVPDETEVALAVGMQLHEYRPLVAELNDLRISDMSEDQVMEQLTWRSLQQNPYDQCLQTELTELLEQVMAELPDKERCVLQLHYFGELPLVEVSGRLGLAKDTASCIHSRAVKRVRARFSRLKVAE